MLIKKTTSFDRDLKRLAKKHFPIKLLKPCLRAIIEQDAVVLNRIKNHALHGNWQGYREFHPTRFGNSGKANDGWIVIYRIEHEKLILILVVTGMREILDR